VERRAHGVAVSGRGRRRSHQLEELRIVDLACRHQLARFPHDSARAGTLSVKPAVEHGARVERNGGDVHGGSRHDLGRGGFVATGGQDHPIDGIAIEQLHQREILQVAVE